MKSIIKYSIIALWAALSTSSCTQFVEVETPKSQLLLPDLFSNKVAAETALANLYAHVRDQGFISGATYGNFAIPIGMFSDEIKYAQNTINDNHLMYNTMITSTIATAKNLWANTYKSIYIANAIIGAAQQSTALATADVDRLVGESLFIRALLHFYLANTFGDVPYVRTTDYRENTTTGKLSRTDVLLESIIDLKEAALHLGESYPTAERIRANQTVVHALMARVYLYLEDWPNAAIMASKSIDQSSTYKMEAPEVAFLKGTKEAIWQLKPAEEGIATAEGISYIVNQNPLSFGFLLQEDFIQSHEAGDLRLTHWIGTYTSDGLSWPFTSKYKQRLSTTGVTTEYSVILRLAEQYLIRAEAYAQLDRVQDGADDLNIVRNRAGLIDWSGTEKQDLLDAILQERRIELFMEYGHRWFDLKRSGKAAAFLKPIKPNWDTAHLLWPIPLSELDANSNLKPQNPGY